MFSATKDLSKRQPVSGRRQMHTVNLDYMISAISFESIEDSLFRFISTFTEGIIALKVEKVKAPQQWQLVIEDLSKHGPAGLPLEAVMMALKVSYSCNVLNTNNYCHALSSLITIEID